MVDYRKDVKNNEDGINLITEQTKLTNELSTVRGKTYSANDYTGKFYAFALINKALLKKPL